jgi:hypothetical protein
MELASESMVWILTSAVFERSESTAPVLYAKRAAAVFWIRDPDGTCAMPTAFPARRPATTPIVQSRTFLLWNRVRFIVSLFFHGGKDAPL